MGVDFYACGVCGECFPDCGPYAVCEDCGEKLCPKCMSDHDVSGSMSKDECPFCTAKEVTDQTLLAYLINELGTSREDVKKAFQAKVAGKIRPVFPLEQRRFREGYKDAVCNYAVWKDGEQLVGVMQRPLKQVLEEIDGNDIPIRY
jgi:hypothetical protein